MLSSSSEGEFTTWPLIRKATLKPCTPLASHASMTWRARKSMKMMLNRRGERGQPCLTPVHMQNHSDWTPCPATRTRLPS